MSPRALEPIPEVQEMLASNVEEKKNICFVIGDDEILFSKPLL